VTKFYTAATAIRACMKRGVEHVEKRDLSKLKLLGTVGEPINPRPGCGTSWSSVGSAVRS
jgi:acetyl-CoA synthetase